MVMLKTKLLSMEKKYYNVSTDAPMVNSLKMEFVLTAMMNAAHVTEKTHAQHAKKELSSMKVNA